MIDTDTLQVGRLVYTRGTNEYHDGAVLGMVVNTGHDSGTGEAFVTILTDSALAPKLQPSVHLMHRDGTKPSTTNLGPLARLVRIAPDDISPTSTDDFLVVAKLVAYARKACLAAGAIPDTSRATVDRGRRLDLMRAAHVLDEAAETIRRGEG